MVFVHGCFWHRHTACALARMPKSRLEFWQAKLEGNKNRDVRHLDQLHALEWSVFVVWECELRDMTTLLARLTAFLNELGEVK